MSKIIYADCNGSHPPLSEVKTYLQQRLSAEGPFGNPNALHAYGRNLHSALEKSRSVIAQGLKAKTEQVIFTSGATEAINTVFHSVLSTAKEENRTHLLISAIEHPAVLETAKQYEAQGFHLRSIKVNSQGVVDLEDLKEALKKLGAKVALVAIMAANNETGALQPYEEIAKICEKSLTPYLCDTTQLIGKMPFDFEKSQVSFAVLSSHKIGGLPGVGVLLAKKPTSLHPFLTGGGQEHGLRSGTQNYLGIETMAVALHNSLEKLALAQELETKKIQFEQKIKEQFKKVTIIADKVARLPGTTAISYQGIHGQVVQIELESRGIFVTTSSACADNEPTTSHVLKAMHFPDEIGRGVIRISFSNHSDSNAYHRIYDALAQAYTKLAPIGQY